MRYAEGGVESGRVVSVSGGVCGRSSFYRM